MVWEKVKESLKETLAENVFNLWIEPIQFVQLQSDRLYLSTPDRYFSAYIKQNFLGIIEEKMQESGLMAAKVALCEEGRQIGGVGSVRKSTAGTQMRLPHIPENNTKNLWRFIKK